MNWKENQAENIMSLKHISMWGQSKVVVMSGGGGARYQVWQQSKTFKVFKILSQTDLVSWKLEICLHYNMIMEIEDRKISGTKKVISHLRIMLAGMFHWDIGEGGE